MTARGRYNNEWDLMHEEFNNSTYDPQYPDDDASGGVQLDHCRLYIRNIPKGLNEEGLRTAFAKYGTLNEVHVSKDPIKRYALVRYETPGEAKAAMAKLNNIEPLKLIITIAHKNKVGRKDNSQSRDSMDRSFSNGPRWNSNREDTASVSSKGKGSRRHEDLINGDELDNSLLPLDDDMDPDTKMKGLQLELQAVLLRQQLLQYEAAKKKTLTQGATSNRCILPDGRIVVRNVHDRNVDSRDGEGSFAAGAGDSNKTEPVCTCHAKLQGSWDQPGTSDGSSTPSTCVLCSEDVSRNDRRIQAKSVASKYTEVSRKTDSSRFDKTTDLSKSVASKTIDIKSEFSKTTVSKRSDATSKKLDVEPCRKQRKSEITCDLKYSDFYSDSEEQPDETNRLIQLRNSDYMDIVDDALKVVIALAGYPKSKMRLRQMEMFQRCLTDVIDMQLKAGLLKKVPAFLDYYLNRGSIVLICKDLDTRDWMVRVCPGLQERMCTNLILLKARVKRLCLAVLKIPRSCWPATAQDAFKLLQYFNPTLKTDLWKIYSQKNVDNVECTSFLIDRVSGEIIRGPNFKNVIDYNQMEFEFTGYTEIYYECLLADLEDLGSVASRIKLLEEIKSADATPRNDCEKCNNDKIEKEKEKDLDEAKEYENEESDVGTVADDAEYSAQDVEKKLVKSQQNDQALDKIKDITFISEKDEIIVWSDDANNYTSDHEVAKEEETQEKVDKDEEYIENSNVTATSAVAVSDKTESVIESSDNLISRSSNLNIDSNRGIAYHRRTNYLDVENELKVAITLEGYPANKLEGTHIRRLKHLFKEYLHKDMKLQKFANLIIPKFQDIYLSNGAVIYICDSLETKDYLTEVLPKFINSTGLKLTFRDIKDLVRYTRVVLRLPKEYAHVESMEILQKLQSRYPGLKPDCWKYYSDVAGKQKRQFGVDPESLDVIKRPDFDPTYEGEKLSFRIIDRQKRDVSLEESSNKVDNIEDIESKMLRDEVVRLMYVPVDHEITNTPLTRIRTNHYSDLIADDLKLYVGPNNYPEIRVDEVLFHYIKRAFESVVCDFFCRGDLDETTIPKFHDMYLFDGVIFIICQSMHSREWMEQAIAIVNNKLRLDLKSTEFRGAVGIVSMVVRTCKGTDEVISTLQKQNPRLRTKYWRKISTVRSKNKLDVVLQIDKLSAQVITNPEFVKYIDGSPVEFKLGHLQSLLNPKFSLEELTKSHGKKLNGRRQEKKVKKSKTKEKTIEELKSDIQKKYPDLKIEQWDVISQHETDIKVCNYDIDESSRIIEKDSSKPEKDCPKVDPVITRPDSGRYPSDMSAEDCNFGSKKVTLKIPLSLVPDNKEDLHMLLDLLEDKNPGLNTELWKVVTDSSYPGYGRFSLVVDRQSASVLLGKNFDPSVGGEKLKFFL